MPKKKSPTCSFCGKGKKDVRQLIVADRLKPAVAICNLCVDVCNTVIFRNNAERKKAP
jgi:ATP-dependent protease Clp ATPase subunit